MLAHPAMLLVGRGVGNGECGAGAAPSLLSLHRPLLDADVVVDAGAAVAVVGRMVIPSSSSSEEGVELEVQVLVVMEVRAVRCDVDDVPPLNGVPKQQLVSASERDDGAVPHAGSVVPLDVGSTTFAASSASSWNTDRPEQPATGVGDRE